MLLDDCTSASDVYCAANQSCDKRTDSLFPLTVSMGSSSVDTKRKLPQHTVRFLDCHVDFYGPEEIYLYQDSTALYIRQKLGMQKVGTRLYRGYNHVARADDKPPDVTHLCFVIHGIGQKMGAGSIMRSVNDLRESCAKLRAKYFSAPEYAHERVEFLPVEWRSSLQLDGDTVDSITPVHVRGLRTTLNSSAMDIMYYTSPLYRAEISASLLTELNRLYTMFCLRNPLFESRGGRVSVIAHSLGCVLIYDLITGWSQPVSIPTSSTRNRRLRRSDLSTPECQGNIDTDHQMETSTKDYVRPTGIFKGSVALGPDISSQRLQRLAQLSLQLEAARTEVSRLEQELYQSLYPTDGLGDNLSILVSGSPRPHSSLPTITTTVVGTVPDVGCSYFTANSLLFKDNLENFFCLGSPLPVFLTLRGIRPGSYVTQDNVLPRRLCPRIFNIYHPADPVAYRLEPLVLKHYSSIQPAVIHRADASDKPDYDDMPLVTYSGKEIRRRGRNPVPPCPTVQNVGSPQLVVSNLDQQDCDSLSTDRLSFNSETNRNSLTSRVLNFFTRSTPELISSNTLRRDGSYPKQTVDNTAVESPQTVPDEDIVLNPVNHSPSEFRNDGLNNVVNFDVLNSDNIFPTSEDVGGSDGTARSEAQLEVQLTDDSLQLEHRLDYQLCASRYENFYISILTSHTSYWWNADVGLFILTQLFRSAHPVSSADASDSSNPNVADRF
ncbi:phospholipase DDHD1 [Paragonimus westermani]|uniref:Phospholipase DDHD1 n=1 Tax=Paragonimus westermani TaxID=34504 RepID=A0A5J4ND03_9TREM|nr:phospholipase DDHD1 [Paragonimus westermani]